MEVDKLVVGILETNCYIVSNNKECIIIDPGDDFELIKKYIEDNSLKAKGILITHYHFDHIQALEKCINYYKVPVIDYKNNIKIPGFDFEIIETKGHHYTSVSYYFKEIQSMFVGDFIFKESIGRIDLEGADENEMLNSLKKIVQYPNEVIIYPGHGEQTYLKYEKENNPYLKEVK